MFKLGKNEVLVEYVPKEKQRYNHGYPFRYVAKDIYGKIQKIPEYELDCTCATANKRYDCPERFFTASAYFGYIFYKFKKEKKRYRFFISKNKYFLEKKNDPENRKSRYYELVKVRLYGKISRLVRKKLFLRCKHGMFFSDLPWDLYHIFSEAIEEIFRIRIKKEKKEMSEFRHSAESDILFHMRGYLQQIRIFDWKNVKQLFDEEWK